jgi:catechol 2,3-dioxygenase-like lactoylglutathione lyase family enzyme
MAVLCVGHLGVCVSNLERSLDFYCDELGFRPLSEVHVNDALSARLLRLPAVDQRTVFVERDGLRLALFEFRRPATIATREPRPMNATGLAALMLRVDDLDGTLAKLRAAGVRVLDDTLVAHPDYDSRLVFVCDPDGTLVELVEIPGDPRTPFGRPVQRERRSP